MPKRRLGTVIEPHPKRLKLDDIPWLDYEYQMIRIHCTNRPYTTIAYHWSVVPDDVLYAIGWITDLTAHMRRKATLTKTNVYREFGFDGIAVDRIVDPMIFDLLQAKCRESVNANDLGSFCTAVRMCQKNRPDASLHAILYCLKDPTPGGLLALEQLNDVVPTTVVHMAVEPSSIHAIIDVADTDKTLRDYQVNAMNAIADWMLQSPDAGVLDMPCATGKTLVVLRFLMTYSWQRVIIIVPSLALGAQWARRAKLDLPSDVTVVQIDCQHERDVPDMHGRQLLVAVVDSVNLVDSVNSVNSVSRVQMSDIDLIIIDEAHDMVTDINTLNDNSDDSDDSDSDSIMDPDDSDDLDNDSNSDSDSIMDSDANSDDSDANSDVDSESLTGRQWVRRLILEPTCHVLLVSATPPRGFPVVYKYDRATAIRDKVVVDYRVYQPLMADGTDVDDASSWSDLTFSARAEFLATACERRGLNAVIVFVQRSSQIDLIRQQINDAVQNHGRRVWIDQVTAETPKQARTSLFQRFSSAADPTELRVLIGIRILDQGIDLPVCDGVFVAYSPSQVVPHSWRRLWQRLGRAMRLDAENPSKIAHMLLWGDADTVERMVRLVADTDTELCERVSAMTINYETRDVTAEATAVEVLRSIAVVGIERVWTTTDKVDLFCCYARDGPPASKTTIDIDGRLWKIGQWWNGIQSNFTKTRKRNRCLSVGQMDQIRQHCTWIPGWIEEFNARQDKKLTRFIPSSTQEAVDLFCQHSRDGPPTFKKTIVIDGRPWAIGTWWNTVYANFTKTRKRNRCLSVGQMDQLRQHCTWIPAWIEEFKARQDKKLTRFIPSSTQEAVDLFCQHAHDGTPVKKKTFHINGRPWSVGQWWHDVQANLTKTRKPTTRLAAGQMDQIWQHCAWIPDWIEEVKARQDKKLTIFIPSSTQEAVDLFCQHAHDGPPVKKKTIDINGRPWSICQWWNRVQPHFTKTRKPTTRLTAGQMDQIRHHCTWI